MLGKEASAAIAAMLVLVLPLAIAPVALGAPTEERGILLVTLRDGARAEDVARRAGAMLEEESLGIAVVRDAPGLAQKLARDRDVLAVERDATVRAASATWNSASWNSASWNSASWNSASWNSASWNSASWNSASWNSASWNSASWNSASWNSASWNSASWNSASWNGAQWNGAQWNGASDGGAQWNGEDEGEGGIAPPWGLMAIRAPEAWDGGVPVHNRLVCMVDTGVDAAHPALAANLAATYNALAPGAPAHDESGHGTHLAGIVAAVHHDAWPVPGVSQARLAVAKALDADGVGLTSDVIEGIAWCGEQDADVVLLAFSEDTPTKAFRAAVANLQRGGALVVASAGNEGCDRCVAAPANLPGVLAVGAVGPDGYPAAFSSRGPEIDLLAPGALITSAYPGESIRTGSGTSQAAAFAAGAAALLWGRAPDLDAHRVSAALKTGADHNGRLDVVGALGKVQEAA